MNNEKIKPIIFCGISNMFGTSVKKTKEEIEQFKSMMSNNGQYDVIYDETNTIPSIMTTIALLSQKNNLPTK